MPQTRVIRAATVISALSLVAASACAPPLARSAATAFEGPAAARRLHADDFQVVNPVGRAFFRERYLDDVGAGVIDYLVWEADSIAVRIYGEGAALRYQSQVEMTVRGEPRRMRAWNTALYERRDGRWQLVWFQVTEVP